MSRIGLQPVSVPSGVTVTVKNDVLSVKGSKGELSQRFEPLVSFSVNEKEVLVSRSDETKRARAMHGLYRSLLQNMVVGVSKGFVKNLIINGVGYRAEVQGKNLNLNLGYSTQIEYAIPSDVNITVDGGKISIAGTEKARVGQVAAEIRGIRPPEPYKGKGVRYETEIVRRKVGKSGVK